MRAQDRDQTPLQGAVPLAQRQGRKHRLRDARRLGNGMGLSGLDQCLCRILKHIPRTIKGQYQPGHRGVLPA